jgi:membrane-associated phospholipid phosphatase
MQSDFPRITIEPMVGSGIEPMRRPGTEPMHRPGLEPMKPKKKGAVSDELLALALDISTASLRRNSDKVPNQTAAAAAAAGAGPKRATLLKWEPWVRVQLGHQQLLSGLVYRDHRLWLAPEIDAKGTCTNAAVELLHMRGPGADLLDTQVEKVALRASERQDRMPEILVQREHLWPFWTSVTNIAPETAPRTWELMEMALELSPSIGMRFKNDIACPRPADLSAVVRPVIETPGHGSFPSGHATAAFLFAQVMAALLGLRPKNSVSIQLRRLALRIADNRVVAGVHYPIDAMAGWQLGNALADYFVARCKGEKINEGGELLGDELLDADGKKLADVSLELDDDGVPKRWQPSLGKPNASVMKSELLGSLWTLADTELIQLGLKPSGESV